MNVIDNGHHDALPFDLGNWRAVAVAAKRHIEAVMGRELTNVEGMAMADDADFAGNVEQMQRDAALRNHASRVRIVPMCEYCEEKPVHVAGNGVQWRFCSECGQEHLQRNKAA